MSGTTDIQDKTIKIISSGDMSANITSSPLDLQGTSAYSIQSVYTGSSPTGTLKIQISNDGIIFSDFASNSTSVSSSGNVLYKITRAGERYVQVTWTFVSGTGTLNTTIALQG